MEEIREVDAETQKEGIDASGPSASNGDGIDSKLVSVRGFVFWIYIFFDSCLVVEKIEKKKR